jgi:hypothetical protein
MYFRLFEEDDETPVIELDEEGIEWFEEGLRELRDRESGDSVTTPTLVSNGGEPKGVGIFKLRRK